MHWFLRVIGAIFFLCGPALSLAAPTPSLSLQSKAREVRLFLEGAFAKVLKRYRIPGAIVSVVEGEQVLFSGGFGYANLETKEAATAESLFRLGGVSKFVTATAVMRLVEQGKLNLQKDVALYLGGLAIQKSFKRNLTLHQLLTGTSGLASTDLRSASKAQSDWVSIRKVVAERMTPQVVEPGAFHLPTHQGFALLGVAVESSSGASFARAVDKLLFAPLGMKNSSFAQPPPKAWRPKLAVGYTYRKAYIPLPLDYSNVSPSNGLVSNARDMALFLSAHMNGGAVKQKRILKPATVLRMHTQQFTHAQGLPGHTYGFEEVPWVSHKGATVRYRTLRCSGSQLGFASRVVLVPSLRLGFFVGVNRNVEAGLRQVIDQFLHTLTPVLQKHRSAAKARKKPAKSSKAFQVMRFVGLYRRLGLPAHSPEKIAFLMNGLGTLTVRTNSSGKLYLQGVGELEPTEEGRFRSIKEGTPVAFRRGKYKEVTHLFVEGRAYQKLSWLESPVLHQKMLKLLLLLFVLTWIAWPFERWLRSTKEKVPAVISGERWAKLNLLLAAATYLLVAGLFGLEWMKVSSLGWRYGLSPWGKAALPLAFLGSLLALGTLLWNMIAWKNSFWSTGWRMFYTFAACGVLLMHFLLRYWNWAGV